MTDRTVRAALATIAAAVTVLNPTLAVFADSNVAPSRSEIVQPAPESSPSAVPHYGDLSHLTFTAKGPLTAQLVEPRDGSASDSTAPMFDVDTVAGAGVEIAVNDKVVSFERIGKRTVDNKTGDTHYFYYGVALDEGPNAVTITPLGANDARGPSTHAVIYGPGRAVKLDAAVVGHATADGRTPVSVRIQGYDRYGHHAMPGSVVKLTILRGDAHFVGSRAAASSGALASATAFPGMPAADAAGTAAAVAVPVAPSAASPLPFDTPNPHVAPPATAPLGDAGNFHAVGDTEMPMQSIDVPLQTGGLATVRLVPGLQPGDVRFRAALGDLAVDEDVYVAPNLRKPLVLGLATTGVGSVPGVPGELATQADGANSRRGRIAIYGVGQVTKTAQVQVAYDTADVLDQTWQYGGNVDNPTQRTYQTYGDASNLRNDALSRDHLYARVDSGKSNAMWGEFQANTAGSTGDGFTQLVAGAKAEIAGNNTRLSVFNAHDDVAYARQVFSPTGLATIGALLHPDIVIGSDVVTLVALDRRTGAILLQTVLARNIDYTLDYGTGQIRFLNPPLPFDLNFNPQQILIEYEYGGPGVSAQTTGGRIETGLGGSQAVRIGAGYVNDATGSTNFTLFSQDATGKLPGGSWSISHETAKGSIGSVDETGVASQSLDSAVPQGNAYRANFNETLGQNHLSANFDQTSANYSNPFGGLSTAGLLDYRVAYQRLLGGKGDSVTISFDHEQNNLATEINSTSNAGLAVQKHVTKRLTLRGGVNVISETGGAYVTTNSALANQVNTVPTPAPAPSASATPAGTAATTATQIDVGAEYRVAPPVAVSVDRISSLSGGSVASQPSQTTAQVNVDLPHHGRAYLRELWADAPVQSFAAATTSLTTASGSTRSTAVGIEQSVGTNTSVDSEYAIENTGSGSNVYSAIGGSEKFFLGQHLHGDVDYQHAAAVGSNGGAFNLYGLSLAYAVGNRFRASGTYELRTGNSSGYTLSVAAVGALSDNVSAFVSSNNSSTSGFTNVDDRVSFAYRPAQDDRAVTLVGFQSEDGNVSTLGDHTQIISLEELYRPDRRLEIAGRYVYKLDGDAYYPAHSSLFGARVTQRVGGRFDVAAEMRYLAAHGIAGASTTGFALEGGYRLGDDFRLAAGYNFSGSPDPSLALAPTRRGLYATATSLIDHVFGWGKDDL